MDGMENKECVINSVDFPFICRICLKRSDLRLFKTEDYLLDLFLTITNIDVRSTPNLPKNICNACIKTLEDISLFIDMSRRNAARPGKNFMREYEHVKTGECGTSQNYVIKTEETMEECEKDLEYFKGFEICRICYSTNILKPVEGKAHLMQLFQNITNIDVKAEVVFSDKNSICNKCIKELETTSSFISVSLCNEMKLKIDIEKNEPLEMKHCLEGNANDIGYRIRVKKDNDFNENAHSYESKDLHTIIDIKEEIVDNPEASTEVRSAANLPKNFCNDCIKTLEDISLFIDISRHNATRSGKNLIREYEHVKTGECGTSQNYVIKTEETMEECEKDLEYFKGFEICRICYSTNILKPVEGKAHLMQLFQNITNIDVKAEVVFSDKNSICNKCIKELETTSSFISVSLCNEMKLKIDIEKNEPLEMKHCLEGNANDMGYRIRVKKDNDFNENAHSYESKDLHTIIDIKEEIVDNPEASTEVSHLNELNIFSENHSQEFDLSSKDEFNIEARSKNLLKGLDIKGYKKTFTQKEQLQSGEKPFKCNGCKKRFNRKGNLQQHMIIHSGEKQFKCNSCEKRFTRRCHLQIHMLIHSGEKQFKCNSCEKRFTQRCSLQNHMLIHSGEKPFKCDCCKKSFTNKSVLRKHLLIHSGEKPFKCNSCDKRFTQRCVLKNHMVIHSGEKPFKCNSCDKRFTRRCNLQNHMLIHSGEKPFKCNSCEKRFNQRSALKNHMVIHSGEKPFKCNSCDKRFIRRCNLQNHMLIHSGEKPFKCNSCEKRFTQRCSLQNHMLIHSGEKPFKCDCCKKSFTNKSALRKHMLIHSGEKPFKCNSCEKRFTQRCHLQIHMLIHSGEKPFKCNSCEKRFTQRRNLQNHMVIHSGEKQFKCDCCKESFTHKSILRRHMLIHSGEKQFKCEICEKRFTYKSSWKNHMFIHSGEKPFKCDCCLKSFILKNHLKHHMMKHTGERPFKCSCCLKSFTKNSLLRQHMIIHTREKREAI